LWQGIIITAGGGFHPFCAPSGIFLISSPFGHPEARISSFSLQGIISHCFSVELEAAMETPTSVDTPFSLDSISVFSSLFGGPQENSHPPSTTS